MRHAIQAQRLSRPSDQRNALLDALMKNLILHGQLQTTLARAKEAQRLADRLVTWGKDGSIHARRQAFRILQDRTLVKRLFADIAPQFGGVPGGYTRVMRLGVRRGDGAQLALIAFTKLPAVQPVTPTPKPAPAPKAPPAAPTRPQAKPETPKERKGLFEGLRGLWSKRKHGSGRHR